MPYECLSNTYIRSRYVCICIRFEYRRVYISDYPWANNRKFISPTDVYSCRYAREIQKHIEYYYVFVPDLSDKYRLDRWETTEGVTTGKDKSCRTKPHKTVYISTWRIEPISVEKEPNSWTFCSPENRNGLYTNDVTFFTVAIKSNSAMSRDRCNPEYLDKWPTPIQGVKEKEASVTHLTILSFYREI